MLDPKYIPLFIGGFIAWICFMIFVGWITSRGKNEGSSFLTKMMTVLLAAEALPDLDTPVTLPEDIFPALYKADASMAGFQPGEMVTVRDLLYGAMLPSGAACSLPVPSAVRRWPGR